MTRRFVALTRVSTTDGAAWGKTVGPLRTLLALAIFRIGQPALSLQAFVCPWCRPCSRSCSSSR